MDLRSNKQAFAVLGVVIAIGILAAMSTAMAMLNATNQVTRNRRLYTDQAFFSTQAGFEFALRKKLVELSAETSFTRHLVSGTITITRTGGLIMVTATKGDGTAAYQITDP